MTERVRVRSRDSASGFTLIELLIVLLIIGTLAGLAVPSFTQYLEQARTIRAVAEIRLIEKEIALREVASDPLPNTLGDLGWTKLDSWGHPYQYLSFAAAGPGYKGKARKDKFLVPLNSTYDLYSMGKDGQSKTPLTAKTSWDDVIRANDGAYVGLASGY
jgi:general secretion pathway protein G